MPDSPIPKRPRRVNAAQLLDAPAQSKKTRRKSEEDDDEAAAGIDFSQTNLS